MRTKYLVRSRRVIDFFMPMLAMVIFVVLGFTLVSITKDVVVVSLVCDVTISLLGLAYIGWQFKKKDAFAEKPLGFVQVLAGCYAFLFLWFVCQQISAWVLLHFTDSAYAAYQTSTDMNPYLYVILAIGVAPVAEEILFRGIWFLHYRRSFGPVVGCFVSAFAFALFHGTVVHLPSTFLFGLFLAFVYHYTGRLMVCMALHVCFNGLALLASDLVIPKALLATPVAVAVYVGTLIGLSALIILYVPQNKTSMQKEMYDK